MNKLKTAIPNSEIGHYEYCTDMMAKLNELREEESLCDVKLLANGKAFPAHRNILSASCPYFNKLFTTDMKEKGNSQVYLEGIQDRALDELLTYFYTGKLKVTQENVEHLVTVSDYFLVSRVKNIACKFLEANLDTSNALYIFTFAEDYNCGSLASASRTFIASNFVEVTKTESFLMLDVNQLSCLLSSDNIIVNKEEEVFEAVVRWAEFNRCERQQFLSELLRDVRLQTIPIDYLKTNVMEHKLIKNNVCCLHMVREAVKQVGISPTDSVFRNIEARLCLQPQLDVVVTCGGMHASPTPRHTSLTRCYLPSADTWYTLAPMATKRNWHGLASCAGSVFVIGGERDGEDTLAVEKFDIQTNTWCEVAPLKRQVIFPGVTTLQGTLFLVY